MTTLKMEDARQIVLRALPEGTTIVGETQEGNLFLFLAPFDDPDEGMMLPFFSVDAETGDFTDFDPTVYENSADILARLQSSSTEEEPLVGRLVPAQEFETPAEAFAHYERR